jgi:squalene-hopene/tetraprenyl-beta-curcumene cyclase
MTRTTPVVDGAANSRPHTAAQTLAAGVANLRQRQDQQGWWKGDLDTNVTMDAEDLLLREFLGIRGAGETEEAARWIRSQQRDDGSWAVYYGGPGDLSTTVEAWVALRLAGEAPDAPHLVRAADFVRANGGLERSRVFTRIWLAMFGLWSWDDLPHLPPELIFFPKWFPFNVYDWGCWARQTIVPLTIVCTLRPVRSLPFGVDELCTGTAALRPEAAPAPPWTWAGFFQRTDRVLHAYSRRPVRLVRRAAMRRAAEWILARQEADGCWGGIQPPWVYSLLALHLLGYSLDHPSLRAGIAGLDGFVLREKTPDGWVRRLEACQSPVWDTVLAVTALLDAGVPADEPAVALASDWLLGEEVGVPGDWAVRRPKLTPGGWAFEFHNDTYPDTDDTAEAILALRRVGLADRSALDRGVAWLIGMQSKDGGWGAFDVDNTSTLCTKLPFCDFGEVIDPPSADVTAHVVEALAAEGLAQHPACRRGVTWLLAAQEPDGSWFGRWGANYVYGTGGVVPALIAAGIPADSLCVRRAIRWLKQHQNDDGGWGEDLRSYDDRAWAGRGESTASQTAWALLALLAAGERSSARERGEQLDGERGEPLDAVERGVGWLCDTQRPDGSWDEPQFTGTGFPGDFYINYHLYRMVFPITALGRYLGCGAP